jgi:D-alanyl-D-alanine dipeptidase
MPNVVMDHRGRRTRAAARCRDAGVAALLIAPGSDLTYLTGYGIFASERITCLVLGAGGSSTLVLPELEAPRARAIAPDLPQRTWGETADPYALIASLVPGGGSVGLSDQMWAAFALRIQTALPGGQFRVASEITRELRMRKDPAELEALQAVSAAADRAYIRALDLEFAGRTELAVAADLAALLRDEGHDEVMFTIVAAGEDGASPHHHTGERQIRKGDTVVLDFGGTRAGYGSDITRTVHVGRAPSDEVVRVHDAVRRAQEAGYAAAREGATAASVDAAARAVIADAGYGERFIHRLGHGIGLDGHEHPYLVEGNEQTLEPGMAFSIEPGIYLPGRFGVRIEDIAIIGPDGKSQAQNRVDRALATVR